MLSLAAVVLAAHLHELPLPARLRGQQSQRPPVESQAKQTGPIHLTFAIPQQNVTAAPVTPGQPTFWIAEWWVSDSKVFIPWYISDDTDGDGSVTLHTSAAYTDNAIFAVVDNAGRVGIASPSVTIEDHDRISVDANQLSIGNGSSDISLVMWVRPGAGAWFLEAFDFGSDDMAPEFGVTRVSPAAFEPYDETYPGPPATFENGDVIVVLYPFEQPGVHSYSLLRIGAAPAAQTAIPTLSTNLLILLGGLLAALAVMKIGR